METSMETIFCPGSKMNVDLEHDWMLVTLVIGGNDLCQYCQYEAM
ncbi:hypothetical protein P4O66_012023, partial [Electrophorus voltai]